MRLISLILIVAALMLLGADAVTSLERGGELTVRSLGTVWGIFNPPAWIAFKSWVQNHAAFMAQGVYSFLALPGWAATGVLGVILAFVFGRRSGRNKLRSCHPRLARSASGRSCVIVSPLQHAAVSDRALPMRRDAATTRRGCYV